MQPSSPNPAATKRILFVDDDAAFLQTIGELFGLRSEGRWAIDLAENTGRALAALQQHTVDLVVIDVQMPVVDGEQFLLLLNRKYPQLRKVVMSGFASPEQRTSVLNHGAELFLEKPRSPDGFESVFSTLDELTNLQAAEGFSGLLRRVGLTDVLQMECLARSSSILEISTGLQRGRIYIKDGGIIHASSGDKTGTEAFNDLLALRGGDFNLKAYEEPPERTIDGQWEFLIMEASRQRDEAAQEVPPPALPVPSHPAPPEDDRVSVPLFPSRPESSGQVVPLRFPNQVAEFIVCSAQGDVLHQWQCTNIDERFKLLEYLAQKAAQLALELPLGQFDRVEVTGNQSRFVARIKPDRQLLLVVNPASGGKA